MDPSNRNLLIGAIIFLAFLYYFNSMNKQKQQQMIQTRPMMVQRPQTPKQGVPVVLGRPSYSYGGYYYDYQNDIEPDAGKCILPRADENCVKRKLYETDGDMDASVALCSSSMPLEGTLNSQKEGFCGGSHDDEEGFCNVTGVGGDDPRFAHEGFPRPPLGGIDSLGASSTSPTLTGLRLYDKAPPCESCVHQRLRDHVQYPREQKQMYIMPLTVASISPTVPTYYYSNYYN